MDREAGPAIACIRRLRLCRVRVQEPFSKDARDDSSKGASLWPRMHVGCPEDPVRGTAEVRWRGDLLCVVSDRRDWGRAVD